MDSDTLLSLMDEVASEIVMAEPSDIEAIASIASQLSGLEVALADTVETAARARLAACAQTLSEVAEGRAKDPEQALAAVSDAITEVQFEVREQIGRGGSPAGVKPEQGTAGDSSAPGSELVLPDYVDEEVFREFLSNTKHVLEEIERDSLLIEKGDAGARSDLKRRIHTLKGEAGVLSLGDFEQVCHAIEDIFSQPISPRSTADLLLETVDWFHRSLSNYADLRLPEPRGDAISARLRSHSDEGDAAAAGGAASLSAPSLDDPPASSDAVGPASADAQPQSFEWDEETVMLVGEFIGESEEGLSGADQILMNIDDGGLDQEKLNALFRTFHTIKGVAGFLELKEITQLAHTTETVMDQVRDGIYPLQGAVLDLVFDSTEIMRAMLAGVREAVEGGTSVRTEPRVHQQLAKLEAAVAGKYAGVESLPEASPGERLGEILTRKPTQIPVDLISEALDKQRSTGRPLGAELVAAGTVTPKVISQALRAQKRAKSVEPNGKIKETVKVDLERVDSLVEMIGELVIVESMVVHAEEISSLASPKVRTYLSQLAKITRDLQDTGMRMRMVPVRGVFQKMARMVRDLGRKSDKSVRLLTSGEGTEMDRSMVEQVTDPLVHMIRNAVDHAIEPADERVRAGKPAEGTVHLSAYHEGGSIVVEISDDGRGLDRDAILDKARRQGIVSGTDPLQDADIFKLIFAPGFSTAKQVTEISGRGVGMDVVKRNIESMRGRISIESEPGRGTTFKLILPLTLAIIDGMLVSCGPEQYIIPTLSIVESLQVTPEMLNFFADKGALINVRGEIFPLLRLDRLFGIEGAKRGATEGLVVVVEGVGRKVGLLVDDVLTQQQVVIKSLGNGIQETPYVSGGAIMSDGTVGLILNVEEIAEIVDRRAAQQYALSLDGAASFAASTLPAI